MTARAVGLFLLACAFAGVGVYADWALPSRIGIALIVLVFVTYLWSMLSLTGLTLERFMETDRLQVGIAATDTIEITNTSHLGKVWIEVVDRGALPQHDASRVVSLGRKRSRSWSTTSVCVRRGLFKLGPVEIRSSDPLGIFSHSTIVPVDREVIVFPPVFTLADFRLPRADISGGTVVDRRSAHTTPAVSTVRDYVPGDPLNHIAWSISAKSGKLMVKEFDLDPTAEVWIIPDFSAQSLVRPPSTWNVDVHRRLRFEEAWMETTEDYVASLAASVVQVAFDSQRAIGLVSTTNSVLFQAAERSERQFRRILQELALAQATGTEPLSAIISREAHRFHRVSSPVVITCSLDPAWLSVVNELTLRGVQPVAIFIDPATFHPALDSRQMRIDAERQRFPVHIVDYVSGLEQSFAQASPGTSATYQRTRFEHAGKR